MKTKVKLEFLTLLHRMAASSRDHDHLPLFQHKTKCYENRGLKKERRKPGGVVLSFFTKKWREGCSFVKNSSFYACVQVTFWYEDKWITSMIRACSARGSFLPHTNNALHLQNNWLFSKSKHATFC